MWFAFALASAFFAGATSILAKIGIKDTDSHVVTALRTGVVLLFAWVMVFISGSWQDLLHLNARSLIFLVLSGLSTGASWLCYFRALQLGDISKVAPVDKSSVLLTMLLAALFLGEALTPLKILSMLLIAAGTYLMIDLHAQSDHRNSSRIWLIYAGLSAVFASLTSILAKVGVEDIESNLATALRTIVVLAMAWGMVFLTNKQSQVKSVGRKSLLFIVLSGFSTGASWLCYYRALQLGSASIVAPIDKLSILVTILFARIFLGERLSAKVLIGLIVLVTGTLLLLF